MKEPEKGEPNLQQSNSFHSEVSFKQELNKRTIANEQLWLQKFIFSKDIIFNLKKLIKYDRKHFGSVSNNQLKESLEVELRRLQLLKSKDKIAKFRDIDNQISLQVIANYTRALFESKNQFEEKFRRLENHSNNNKWTNNEAQETRQNLMIKRYDDLLMEIQKKDGEIKKFMKLNIEGKLQINYVVCKRFFNGQIQKIKHLNQERMIVSRIKILQVIQELVDLIGRISGSIVLVEEAVEESEDSSQQSIIFRTQEGNQQSKLHNQYDITQHDLEKSKVQQSRKTNRSNESQDQVNKYSRYSSKDLLAKVLELSCICEQIPQLQTFKRTLQFSLLEHDEKVAFFKIIEVLISLHHKVHYLSRNKPSLMKEFQNMEEEVQNMNNHVNNFMSQIDEEAQLFGISFDQGFDQAKKSQLSEHFNQMKHNLVRLVEIVISQDLTHQQNQQQTHNLKRMVTNFYHILAGYTEYEREWEELLDAGQSKRLSENEMYILQILEQGLDFHKTKVAAIVNLHNSSKMETASQGKTNEELGVEINKLINDYQKLQKENFTLAYNLDILNKEREDFMLQIEQRDCMINNLSHLKVGLEKKLYSESHSDQQGKGYQQNKHYQIEVKKKDDEIQLQKETILKIREQLKATEAERNRGDEEERDRTRLTINKLKLEIDKQNIIIDKLKNGESMRFLGYQIQIEDLNKEKQVMQKENEHLKQAKAKQESKIQDLLNELHQASQIVKSLEITAHSDSKQNEKVISKLERQIEKIKKDFDMMKSSYQDISQENSENIQVINELKLKIKQYKLKAEEENEKDEVIQELKNKVQKHVNKFNAANKEIQSMKEEQEEKNRKVKTLQKKYLELEEEKCQMDMVKNKIFKEKQQLLKHIQQIQRNLEETKDTTFFELKKGNEEFHLKQKTINDLNLQIQKLTDKVTSLEAELAKKSNILVHHEAEILDLNTKNQQNFKKQLQNKLNEYTSQFKVELKEREEEKSRLNKEIDRLELEINRLAKEMSDLLKKLSEKEHVIQLEQDKNLQNQKIIHQYSHSSHFHQIGSNQIKNKQERKESFERQDKLNQLKWQEIVAEWSLQRNNFEKQLENHYKVVTERDQLKNQIHYLQQLHQIHLENAQTDLQRQVSQFQEKLKMYSISLSQNQNLKKQLQYLIQQVQVAKINANHHQNTIENLKREIAIFKEKQQRNESIELKQNNKHQQNNQKIRVLENINKNLERNLRANEDNKDQMQRKQNEEYEKLQRQLLELRQVNKNIEFALHREKTKQQNKSESLHFMKAQKIQQLRVIDLQNEKRDLEKEVLLLKQSQKEVLLLKQSQKEVLLLKQLQRNKEQANSKLFEQNISLQKQILELKNGLKAMKDQHIILTNNERSLKLYYQQIQTKLELEKESLKDLINSNSTNKEGQQNHEMVLQMQNECKHLHAILAEKESIISQFNFDFNQILLERENLLSEINQMKVFIDTRLSRNRNQTNSESIALRDHNQNLISLLRQAELKQIENCNDWKRNLQELEQRLEMLKLEANEKEAVLTRQRDQLQIKQISIKSHLEEETKKVLSLQSQLQNENHHKCKEKEVHLSNTIQDQKRQAHQLQELLHSTKTRIEAFFIEKIRVLEEALKALSQEFNQLKRQQIKPNHQLQTRMAENTPSAGVRLHPSHQIATQIPPDNDKKIIQNLSQENTALRLEMEKQNAYIFRLNSQFSHLEKQLHETRIIKTSHGKTTTMPHQNIPLNSTYSNDHHKYFLRVQGEEILRSIEGLRNNNHMLNNKIDEMLELSRRGNWNKDSNLGGNVMQMLKSYNIPANAFKQLDELVKLNQLLLESVKSLRAENGQLLMMATQNPITNNVLEFIFRILIYFSDMDSNSQEAANIRNELMAISQKYKEGLFFTVLEEYTIHLLDNNAIEEYKRELRAKARELLEIKQRLDQLIHTQIQQEENICNRKNQRGESYGQKLHRSREASSTKYYGDQFNRTPQSYLSSNQSTPNLSKK